MSATRETAGCGIPVEEVVHDRLDVIGAGVLPIEVVRMLPYIDDQKRHNTRPYDRGFRVCRAFDRYFAAIGDKPSPTASEPLYAGVGKRGLAGICINFSRKENLPEAPENKGPKKQKREKRRLSLSDEKYWWAIRDSNPRPLPCEGSALTN